MEKGGREWRTKRASMRIIAQLSSHFLLFFCSFRFNPAVRGRPLAAKSTASEKNYRGNRRLPPEMIRKIIEDLT